jgi:2Fe-2S ferredoxin
VPHIIVVDRAGTSSEVAAKSGHSVMEIIRDAGFDELLALCGGSCSCATCHVHVAPEWFAKVGPANADEDDLLDSSDSRVATSRLSCQIDFTPALDGLMVTIAPED